MAVKRFSVATCNLLNLNLPGVPLYDAPGWTPAQYDRKVAWTAHQLTTLGPDVMALEELWHRQAALDILAAAGAEDAYDVLTPPWADGSRIVCAALVRKGLGSGSPEWREAFPEGFRLESAGEDPQTPAIALHITGWSRPVLRFRFTPHPDAPAVTCYVAHLKSKAPTRIDGETWYDPRTYGRHAPALGAALSTIRRTAEAAALRWELTRATYGNNDPVLVLGDLNDDHNSTTLNILTGQPRYLVGDSRGGGGTSLYASQTLQEYRDSRDVYYTYVHQELRQSLDHVLLSEQFYDNSRRRLWLFDGLVITNDHLDLDDHPQSGSSDHGVVRVTFRWAPVA